MDILVPYQKSKHNGEELRFMLRSAAKNLSDLEQVFIVGDLPTWASNVIYIPVEDFPNHKQASICNKIMQGALREDISNDFIRWCDDIYLLKRVHSSDIKYWFKGDLQQWQDSTNQGYYRDVIFNTKVHFSSGTLPYYDLHTPIVHNKFIFRDKMKFIVDSKKEMLIKSSYCYLAEVKGEIATERDVKINYPHVDFVIADEIKGRTFFSIGDHAVSRGLIKVLNGLFKDKSKYEL